MAALCVSCPHAFAGQNIPQDKSKAVILAYFGISDDGPPDTTIAIDTFKDQVAEIKSGGYHVLGLPELLQKIKAGAELPQ